MPEKVYRYKARVSRGWLSGQVILDPIRVSIGSQTFSRFSRLSRILRPQDGDIVEVSYKIVKRK